MFTVREPDFLVPLPSSSVGKLWNKTRNATLKVTHTHIYNHLLKTNTSNAKNCVLPSRPLGGRIHLEGGTATT